MRASRKVVRRTAEAQLNYMTAFAEIEVSDNRIGIPEHMQA
jgi:hypothetical protein